MLIKIYMSNGLTLLIHFTAQKMKFSITDFFSKCDQIRRKLGTFTAEIRNGKLHFCAVFVHSTNKIKQKSKTKGAKFPMLQKVEKIGHQIKI